MRTYQAARKSDGIATCLNKLVSMHASRKQGLGFVAVYFSLPHQEGAQCESTKEALRKYAAARANRSTEAEVNEHRMQAYTRLLPLVVLKGSSTVRGRFVSEVESEVCPHIRYVVRPHWWPVAHSLIPCTHEYTVAHMAGWVLGQNTVDPHRPTHSHTLYAYKAYCAPTHTYTHTQHEQ